MKIVFCHCTSSPRLLGHASFSHDETFTFSSNKIEHQIQHIDDELRAIFPIRDKINQYKHKKDELSTLYIQSQTYNQNLDIQYVNYRALIKQFRDIFENPYHIQLNHFSNNKIKNTLKLSGLNSLIGSGIYCKTEEINFPHLIGIKTNPPTINRIKDFINNIHYEQSLIKDYAIHNMDADKLKSFGWIKNTINDPDKVFLSNAITSTHLRCDIAFVKKIDGNPEFAWHIVCMTKTNYSFKNKRQF